MLSSLSVEGALTLKQRQLICIRRHRCDMNLFTVELLVRSLNACFVTLLTHVIRDGVFVSLRPHRRNKVTVRSLQLLFDVRTTRKHLARDQTFEQGDDLGRAVSRHALQQQMRAMNSIS